MTHTTEEPAGLVVGDLVGDLVVGESVGLVVGLVVGELVVGESVGLVVGDLVVGLVVGESVGLIVDEPAEQHQSLSQRHHLHRFPKLLCYHLAFQC